MRCQFLPQRPRQNAIEILQSHSAHFSVFGMKSTKRQPNGPPREHQSQQRKDVLDALGRAILKRLVYTALVPAARKLPRHS